MEQGKPEYVLDFLDEFKFHYVQMELKRGISAVVLVACLNSTMFRWNCYFTTNKKTQS
jgi:hypothetical protein